MRSSATSSARPTGSEHEAKLHGRLRLPGWVAPLYATLAVVLVPWIVYLALTLPQRDQAHHYNLSWVGFDCLLLVAMIRTGWLAARDRPGVELPAAVVATLLVVDAWFDVTTAAPGSELLLALLLAAVAELPMAAMSLVLARRALRMRTAA